ncbi:MAG TPA: glucosyl-3-phosphoglycerate synthase [Acidimicrobiales bacterium]|nr:glucosyl-3-phosphoglycerate synthase [Acidimicrobiales bacterium]
MAVLDAALPAAPPIATYHPSDWELDNLVAAKAGGRVVVCIPARDEVRTIGAIVACVRDRLLEEARLVDEIVVVDDGSCDGTGAEARHHGATVVPGPGLGKGEAMLAAKGRGDYIVYLDGDVENFAAHYVSGLLGPLLCGSGHVMVKGSYSRPLGESPTGGGRVTELVAKPLISLLFPDLCGVDQPLAGETAMRSQVLEEIELAGGYGVEMGLLIDVWRRWGTTAIAQVELGERRHRNRPLSELGPQAREVIASALARAALV